MIGWISRYHSAEFVSNLVKEAKKIKMLWNEYFGEIIIIIFNFDSSKNNNPSTSKSDLNSSVIFEFDFWMNNSKRTRSNAMFIQGLAIFNGEIKSDFDDFHNLGR